MFRNYLKIATRHLLHSKLYSIINIVGLSIGIACVMLAVLFYNEEHSYDEFHENRDQLFRIVTTVQDKQGVVRTVAGSGQPQGPAFAAAVPEIVEYTRVLGGDIRNNVVANGKNFSQQSLFVDSTFFKLFTFTFLRGDKNTALNDIGSIVITESVAQKYFNSIDVIGKTLELEGDPSAKQLAKPMTITGVVKDPPKNSSIRFDVLMSLKFFRLSGEDTNWLNQYLGLFLLIRKDADHTALINKLNQVYAIHAREQVSENQKTYGFDPKISFELQNITEMHLNPMPNNTGWREGGIVNEGNPRVVNIFLAISIFILVMGGINFINISIGTLLKRAKEVGVRKITGGSKAQIIAQFMLESAILCTISFFIAAIVTQISVPLFNELAGKQLLYADVFNARLITAFICILLLIILTTGLYPAFILSGFKPAEVLYQRQKLSGRNLIGKSLVVMQFALAVFFIIASLVYYRQMDFIRTKDLGYIPYQVIRTHIEGDRDISGLAKQIKAELDKEPAINYISFGGEGDKAEVRVLDKEVKSNHHKVDENHIPALGMKILAGRNFSPQFGTEITDAVIVNEAFVKAAGLANPIGTKIKTLDYIAKEEKTIVGVVKDFHTATLHHSIEPLVMIYSQYNGGVWIKIDKEKQSRAIAAVQQAFKKAFVKGVFYYEFLDEMNAKSYVQEKRWQKILGISTALSIFISCIGLFGLAHLAAQQRIKEIGIRKVLGATAESIAGLLSRDFIRLVIIAILIATPLAWIAMNRWLNDFAYRTEISWWLFIIAGCFAVVIALLTVSMHAIRAAMGNPVKSLRTE